MEERSRVEAVKVFLGRKDASKAKAYPRLSSWRGVTQTTPFVTMPPSWAATDVTLIHELAHICVGTREQHGPKYAACYLDMIRKFGGSVMHDMLRESFDDQRVEYGDGEVKSTRTVEREAARERERPKLSRDDETFLRLIGM